MIFPLKPPFNACVFQPTSISHGQMSKSPEARGPARPVHCLPWWLTPLAQAPAESTDVNGTPLDPQAVDGCPGAPGGHPFQESYGKLEEATKIWNVIPTIQWIGLRENFNRKP